LQIKEIPFNSPRKSESLDKDGSEAIAKAVVDYFKA
jgi:hypothetical protein